LIFAQYVSGKKISFKKKILMIMEDPI
jgi:hypothetical protein